MSMMDRWDNLSGMAVSDGKGGYTVIPFYPPAPVGGTLTAAATEETVPYHIAQDIEGCSGYAVVKDADSEVMGCHDSEAEAEAQMAALYANEADADGTVDAALEQEEWHAVIAPEGKPSGDGREFAPGSLEFRDLPLPLRWIEQDMSDEHRGAVAVGKITRLERVNGNVEGWGTWDTSDAAIEARRLVDEGIQRWVSVDADDVSESDVEFVFPEGTEDDDMLAMPELTRFTHARVAAATIVQIPAFQEAVIEDLAFPAPADAPTDAPAASGEEPKSPVTYTGAMVALVPDADTINRLALDDGLGPDDLHLTLIYLGDSDLLDPTARQAVTSSAEALQRRGVIGGQAFGAALFNPQGDEPAAVLVLEAPEVRTLRDELMPQIEHLVPDDAHDFVPHVTLTYPTDQMAALQAAIERTGDIRFDRLRVAFGNEVTDFPLDIEDLSLVAAAFPVEPPDEWFQDPGLTGPVPFTVDDSGRVYGHLATWGTCHTGVAGTCRTAPHENEFAYFQLGEVVAQSGARIPVGQVTMGTGHASSTLKQMAAAGHYDDTGYVAADVVAGNDKFGIWVAGAARPDLSEVQLRQLRAAKLSGDWRKFGTKLRLVAALAVNVPGFPIPRTTAGVRHGEQTSLIASGVVVDGAESQVGGRNYDLLADRVAASIGRDTKSQVASLAARLGRE